MLSELTPLRQLVEHLDERGDAIVIETPTGVVAAAELARLARSWARRLDDAELIAGDIALIIVRDRVELCASILACQLRGVIFAPVDPDLPQARLRQLAETASARAIIGDEPGVTDRFRDTCDALDLAWVTTTASEPSAAARIEPSLAPDSSYLYFTSGSSGAPRPVLGRHSSLEQFIHWEIDEFDVTGADRCTQLVRPWFDAFLRDMFVPLAAGAVLILAANDPYAMAPDELARWISTNRVTFMHCGPTLLRRVSAGAGDAHSMAHIRHVLASGEPLLGQDVADWMRARGSASALVNFYGTTETTMIKMAHRVAPDDALRLRVPVGRAIPGCAAIVVDDELEPVDDGVSGEVLLVGSFFTAGYLGDADATRMVFLEDPSCPDNLRYRTGDIGRIMPDGAMELLGRRDAQLKIHGVRIEPLEVEEALRSIEGVDDAVVDEVGDQPDGQLGALVASAELDGAAIRAALARRLSSELVPTKIHVVVELPLTPSGKADRRQAMQLLEASAVATEKKAGFDHPRTDTELAILEVFATVLNDDSVGVEHDFFASGGDSLSAMQVVARLRRDAGIDIQIRDLFERPTARALASPSGSGDSMSSVADVAPAHRVDALEPHQALTSTQQRIWFVEQLGLAGSAYRVSAAVRLVGPIDRRALERSLSSMLEHRELWRGRFVVDDGGVPWFEVPQAERDDISVAYVEADNVEASLHGETLRPIDLLTGPLMRVTVYGLGSEDSLLVLSTHHIVADESSMRSAMIEVAHNYRTIVSGGVPESWVVDRGYAVFAHAEEQWLEERGSEAEQFWAQQLAGLRPIGFPGPAEAISAAGTTQNEVLFALDTVLTERIESIARTTKSTPFAALAGAVALAVSRLTGCTDLAISTSLDLRDGPELVGAVGVFVNSVVLRLAAKSDHSAEHMAAIVREAWLDAHPHRYYPFDRVHSMSRPVASINVDYHGALDASTWVLDPATGTGAERIDPPHLDAKFPIDFSFERTGDGIAASARFQPDVVDVSFVNHLVIAIQNALGSRADEIDLSARRARTDAFFG